MQSFSGSSTSACIVCNNQTTMRCSRCQRAWYCSPQHSEQDWPRHSQECIPFTTQSNPSGRQDIYVAGLLFDPQSDRPLTVTIACRPPQMVSASSDSCPTPMVQQYFRQSPPQSVVITQGLNGENLRYPLHLFYCPISLARGTPVNRAVAGITSGAAKRPWAGPVLVLKYSGTRKGDYIDASQNDLPNLSAYFLGFN